MDNFTRKVQSALQARGVSTVFITRGHHAMIDDRIVKEDHAVYRDAPPDASEAQLATGIVNAILKKCSAGIRRITIREVNISKTDERCIVHTAIGF
jgi:hypothetical protein